MGPTKERFNYNKMTSLCWFRIIIDTLNVSDNLTLAPFLVPAISLFRKFMELYLFPSTAQNINAIIQLCDCSNKTDNCRNTTTYKK